MQTQIEIKVIRCIVKDITLCDSDLDKRDFEDRNNKTMFLVLKKMFELNYKKITEEDVKETINNYFGNTTVREIAKYFVDIESDNFWGYKTQLKKLTVLRYYDSIGFKDNLCPSQWDEGTEWIQLERISNMTFEDIYNHFEDITNEARDLGETTLVIGKANTCRPQAKKRIIMSNPDMTDGMLYTKTVNMFAGASKTGKSFFTQELAMRVQNGIDWTMVDSNTKSKKTLHINKSDVLLVDFEMAEDDISDRYELIESTSNIVGEPFDRICVKGTDASFDTVCNTIKRWVKNHPNAGLVIMDCWYSFFSEGDNCDENSASDTKKILKKLDKIAALDVAVLYIHHYSKTGSKDKSNKDANDKADKSSGSNVHARNGALLLTMDKQYDKNTNTELYTLDFGGRYVKVDNNSWTAVFKKENGVFVAGTGRMGFPSLTQDEKRKKELIMEEIEGKEYLSLPTVKSKYEIDTKGLKKLGFVVDTRANRVSFRIEDNEENDEVD